MEKVGVPVYCNNINLDASMKLIVTYSHARVVVIVKVQCRKATFAQRLVEERKDMCYTSEEQYV